MQDIVTFVTASSTMEGQWLWKAVVTWKRLVRELPQVEASTHLSFYRLDECVPGFDTVMSATEAS